ncbi:FCD domain-containing protein [Ancylobacter pratisalsi]|uniref:FCD domain-containing protein n=1 Tax=Ancylobacter pratisalsi TaxID=1745854 RepID=A0A6P1YPF4_9HYPH|nr:FCD domain-containing protein [Ancylobacter pratisalsi]QIB34586.1 FCD domain-containing protein [Ancylobacter pratisalsi]
MSQAPIHAIKRNRLFDQIAEHLSQMIYSGELKVGDTLPSERELMERFQVGRPAVREALLWLNKKGLISVSGGERARVTAPDPKDILDQLSGAAHFLLSQPQGVQLFQQTRLLVEVALAREAARSASDEQIAELQTLLVANLASVDIPDFVQTDDAFHFAVARVAGNPVINALYEGVLELLQDQRHTALKDPRAMAAARKCHEAIFQSIATHDPDRAEAEMRQHLHLVETYYWAVRSQKP